MPIGKGTNLFAADDSTVKVDRTDPNGNAMSILCTVANLPTGVGYAVSCTAQTSDGGIYQNTGTTTSATWTLMDTASGSLTLPAAATDATTTTTTSLALTQNAVTTGAGLTQALNGLTTGKGHSITHTTSVISAGGTLLNLSSTGIDTTTTSGSLLNLSSTASTASTLMKVTSASLTTGKGLVFTLAGLTTGAAIDTTGIAATTQNFNMNSTTGSTAAPQTNAPVGFFKIGIGGTDQWVPYYGAS